MTMEKSWAMMKDRIYKETRRLGRRLFHKWGAAYRKELFVIFEVASGGCGGVTNA